MAKTFSKKKHRTPGVEQKHITTSAIVSICLAIAVTVVIFAAIAKGANFHW